jgi:hypothetical protein
VRERNPRKKQFSKQIRAKTTFDKQINKNAVFHSPREGSFARSYPLSRRLFDMFSSAAYSALKDPTFQGHLALPGGRL